jgi:myosin heavy subunit
MFGGEKIRPSFELLSKIIGAFKLINFSENEIENIWRLLAAILHLGNLRYNGLINKIIFYFLFKVKNFDGNEHLELNDRLNIQRICKLLKVFLN